MWKLVEEKDLKYFRFTYEDKVFLYSTRIGTQKFLDIFKPLFLKQIHSAIIVNIDTETKRTGDGILTAGNKSIGVKIADCLPVYIFSGDKMMILHCGWRSIYKGILRRARGLLKNYHYVLGAGIGVCCYEVKNDVASLYYARYPEAVVNRNGRLFLDLKKAVQSELGLSSLMADLNYCTYCHPHYFYSHRRGDKERNYAVLFSTRE
ncbi:MAG: polyphenol oxidase family protein [candidate division WOR-3 bacterium]